MKKAIMWTVILVMGTSLCAMAQPFGGGEGGGEGKQRGPGGKRARKGKKDRTQFMQKMWGGVDRDEIFAALDADSDGSVSKAEFAEADLPTIMGDAMRKGMMKARAGRGGDKFKTMDKNADGKLTKDEFPRPEIFDHILEKADTNGDGELTQEEMQAFHAKRQERGGKRERKRKGRDGDE